MLLKTIIVDNEPHAVAIVEKILLKECHNISIVGKTTRPSEAISIIMEQQPDMVFLDIEMGSMSGFDLLDHLPSVDFEVVFVTAWDHYALDAIKKQAIDYLLKPVRIKELVSAVEKVRARKMKGQLQEVPLHNEAKAPSPVQTIKIPTASGIDFIKVNSIRRLEANGSYTKIFTCDKQSYLASKTLKEIEQLLQSQQFFRAHRSHIINISFIKSYMKEGNGIILLEDGTQIPLSRRQRDAFMNILNEQ